MTVVVSLGLLTLSPDTSGAVPCSIEPFRVHAGIPPMDVVKVAPAGTICKLTASPSFTVIVWSAKAEGA